jgi:uncharacterized protein YneF (UPF0154 family)
MIELVGIGVALIIGFGGGLYITLKIGGIL